MDYPPVLPIFETFGKQAQYGDLEKYFKTKYGYLPSFYVRVPGRVNVIGEHIDYCGFPVFPMAIEQDIVIAVRTNNEKVINLSNVDSNCYDDFSTSVDSLTIDQTCPKWYHYFLCGFKGILEESIIALKGLDVAVKGTIPPSSGLSSSSALVCASALATAYANSLSLTKLNIASACAKCERYIGTQGGGMDQAIAFLAEPGSAKLIEFNPLKATNVPLPKGASFVVANSCVPMNKAASSHFNIRVVECRLAAKILAKALKLDLETVKILRDIVKLLDISLSSMASILKQHLHQKPYSKKEVCQLLKISENELESRYLSKNTEDLMEFKLYDRALHVYSEAARVMQFKTICERTSDTFPSLHELGKLMNESHASCRDLYECSHPQLDELVNISIEAGALGSRLTGAGWGGCCVSLVQNENIDNFIEEVKVKFYLNDAERKKMFSSSLFVTQPGGGAVVYTI